VLSGLRLAVDRCYGGGRAPIECSLSGPDASLPPRFLRLPGIWQVLVAAVSRDGSRIYPSPIGACCS